MKNKKIAVVFPGVGYHADKPLLYYSRKLAAQYGYEVICAEYGRLPSGIKGDAKKMYEAYEQASAHVEEQLSRIDFSSCSHVLFLSKSIGTAVAASYDRKKQIGAGHVYYTPVLLGLKESCSMGRATTGQRQRPSRRSVQRGDCRSF